MSGHNKWSSIKHRKGAQDKKRAKIFTKLIKELTIAARLGGGDQGANPRLRLAVVQARAANMPKDNIERAIKKGTGELEGVNYEEVTYEGYGPAGVALLIETLTENTNRTVSEVRTVFNKRGGKMGEPGSVAWMFEQKGQISIPQDRTDFDTVFEAALEAGADDVEDDDERWLVTTAREDLFGVSDAIEAAGLPVEEAMLAWVPTTPMDVTSVSGAKKVLTLIDHLEDCDDVQRVWSNVEISDEIAEQLEAEE